MRPDDAATGPDRSGGQFDPGSLLRDGGSDRNLLVLWGVTVVIVVGLWLFFWDFASTLVVGLFVYYVTRPVFAKIHSRVHNRTLAVVGAIVAVALPVLVLIGWALAVLFQTLGNVLTFENQEQLEQITTPYLDVSTAAGTDGFGLLVTNPIQFFQTDLSVLVAGVLDGLIASVDAVVTVGVHGFIVLVITFYLLRDDYRIAAWARRTVAREGGVVETYLTAVDRDLKNVFFGNILNALVTGLIAVLTYLVLNAFAPEVVVIPQPALLGLLAGAASLVPVVGIKLVTWPIGFYLLVRSAVLDPSTLWFPVLFFVVDFVVVDYIPDQLLRPYVSGRTLHVGAIMLAYLFGPILFGWAGIFLGPFLLVLVFEFGRVVVPWLVNRTDVTGAAQKPPVRQSDEGNADAGTAPRVDEGPEGVDGSDEQAT